MSKGLVSVSVLLIWLGGAVVGHRHRPPPSMSELWGNCNARGEERACDQLKMLCRQGNGLACISSERRSVSRRHRKPHKQHPDDHLTRERRSGEGNQDPEPEESSEPEQQLSHSEIDLLGTYCNYHHDPKACHHLEILCYDEENRYACVVLHHKRRRGKK